jgi:hypothetical protein
VDSRQSDADIQAAFAVTRRRARLLDDAGGRFSKTDVWQGLGWVAFLALGWREMADITPGAVLMLLIVTVAASSYALDRQRRRIKALTRIIEDLGYEHQAETAP